MRQHVTSAACQLERPVACIGVSIINDQAMSRLHLRHSGIDGTTDVLTFPSSEPGDPIQVDIAVCADEASRRAAEFGHSVNHELLLYVIHGLLHCAGHNDHTEEGYRAMHAEEDRILTAIGVGAVFHSRPRDGADAA